MNRFYLFLTLFGMVGKSLTSLISTASLYDDDAGITCYGYIPPGLPGVHKFHETLAEFCIDEVGADCTQIMASDADLQDPNAPETTIVGFDSLEGHIDVYREMEPLNIDEILGDDVVQNIQRRELICESKCICTKDILTDTTNGNGGGVPSLNRSFWQSPGIPKHASLDNSAHEPENVWEWNFDDHKARSRPRSGRQEKVFWRGGHGFAGWGWSFYVGAEENRPTCSAGRLSDIPDGSSSPLNQEHYGSIAEACLHRYYGGSNFTNKGGICQRTEEGERILVFPYSLSAPWFLGEFDYDPTYQVLPYPAGVAAKYSLKDFAEGQTLSHPHAASLFHWEYTCWANCWCDDKEKETKENIEQWLLLKGHYYHGITENDLQKFGLLGSSGRGKPEAPNRRLSKRPKVDTCSAFCGSVADNSCGRSCVCKAFEAIDAIRIPGQRSFVGRCAAAVLTSSIISGLRTSSRLNPRGESGADPEPTYGAGSSLNACPCNSTYVSQSCCLSKDGLVWEDPGLKLGELK